VGAQNGVYMKGATAGRFVGSVERLSQGSFKRKHSPSTIEPSMRSEEPWKARGSRGWDVQNKGVHGKHERTAGKGLEHRQWNGLSEEQPL